MNEFEKKQEKYIKRIKRFTHIHDEDLEVLEQECKRFDISYEVCDDDFIYLNSIGHAIEIYTY